MAITLTTSQIESTNTIALFENRTPPEIIQYLNERFWNGKYKGLEAQIQNRSV